MPTNTDLDVENWVADANFDDLLGQFKSLHDENKRKFIRNAIETSFFLLRRGELDKLEILLTTFDQISNSDNLSRFLPNDPLIIRKLNIEYALVINDLELAEDLIIEVQGLIKDLDQGKSGIYLENTLGDIKKKQSLYQQALDHYSKAITLSEQIEDQASLSLSLKNRGIIYRRQGKLKLAREHFERALDIARSIDHPELHHGILHVLGVLEFVQAKYDKALPYFKHSLKIRRSLRDLPAISQSLHLMGMINNNQGNLESAKKYLTECLQIREQLKNPKLIADTKGMLGKVLENQGQLSQALEYYQEGLEIDRATGNNVAISIRLLSVGRIFQKLGNYSKALQLFKEGSVQIDDFPKIQVYGINLMYQAEVISLIDNLDVALSYFLEASSIFDDHNNNQYLATCYHNIAEIYLIRGNLQEAKESIEKAINLRKQIDNPIELVDSYAVLIQVQIQIDNIEEAQVTHGIMKSIENSQSNPYIELNSSISEALILQQTDRFFDMGKAQQIFRGLSASTTIDFHLKLRAMVNLCNLLVKEVRTLQNESVIIEISELLSQVLVFSSRYESSYLQPEIYYLTAKLSYLKGDTENALNFIERAKSIAEDQELLPLYREIDRFEDTVRLVYTSEPQTPLNTSKAFDYPSDNRPLLIKPELHQGIKEEKETPVALAIVNSSGRIKFSLQVEEPLKLSLNEISKYVKSYVLPTTQDNQLSRMVFDDFKLIISKDKKITLCYFYSGNSFKAQHKLKSLHQVISTRSVIVEHLIKEISTLPNSISKEIVSIVQTSFDEKFSKFTTSETFAEHLSDTTSKTYSQLQDFKDLLHPVRLVILTLLQKFYRLPRTEIQEIVDVSSGTLSTHLDRLVNLNYISKNMEIVDQKPRVVYYLEAEGGKTYNELQRNLDAIMGE